MKLKEQKKINYKEFKWSAKHIKFIVWNKIKKHIQLLSITLHSKIHYI